MISDKSGLSNRLGWVLDETEQMLEHVRRLFAGYSQDDDEAKLNQALEVSRNVLGILDVLEAEGAYMLNREMVLLMDAIRQSAVDDPEDANTICADGLLQLSEYLRHLHDGYADLPVIILPTLNNLRAARKADLLSEHLVFLPVEGSITNEQIGTEKYVQLSAEKRGVALQRLRFYMQKALLGWYKDDQSDSQQGKHLPAARKVVANLLVMNKGVRPRSLWWISSALLQALDQNKLESNAAVKMLVGRLEREIKRFSEEGEAAYNEDLPDELLKNLLYYVGLSEDSSGQLQAVKEAYHLDLYLPKGETLEELRNYYSMPGRELWHSVAGSMQDELSLLMMQVEGLNGRVDPESMMVDVANRTQSLAQTLSMLGLGKAASLTEDQATRQLATSKNPGVIEKRLLEGMSEHYIKLEKVLEEYAESGHDRTEVIFSEQVMLSDPGASREAIRSLLVDIAKAQSELGVFSQSTTEFAHVDEAVKLLNATHGTIDVLGYGELQPLIDGAKDYLQLDILQNRREPETNELSCLADIVTLLEASLSCIEQGDDYLPLLPTGYEKLEALDKFCALDLLGRIDLKAANDELNIKKKARQSAPKTLYEKVRSPQLLTG
uniref:Scaffold protein FimL second domain-containing protein n=1 Tax=uncultured Thiotrichaceae bacterium TaxID=298394 RepID=A0A6S6SNA5_9GAMM|nr:MAG: Unknown protein [uncultured Thiotrichaceae bacterium]